MLTFSRRRQQGQALVAVLVVMTVVFVLAGTVALATSALVAQYGRPNDAVALDLAAQNAVAASVAHVTGSLTECATASSSSSPSPAAASPSPSPSATRTPSPSPALTPSPSAPAEPSASPSAAIASPTPSAASVSPSATTIASPSAGASPSPSSSPAALPSPSPSPSQASLSTAQLSIALVGGDQATVYCRRLDGVATSTGARNPLARLALTWSAPACASTGPIASRQRVWAFFTTRWTAGLTAYVAERGAACRSEPPSDATCMVKLPAPPPGLAPVAQVSLSCDLTSFSSRQPELYVFNAGRSPQEAMLVPQADPPSQGGSLYMLTASTGSGARQRLEELLVLVRKDGSTQLLDEEPVS